MPFGMNNTTKDLKRNLRRMQDIRCGREWSKNCLMKRSKTIGNAVCGTKQTIGNHLCKLRKRLTRKPETCVIVNDNVLPRKEKTLESHRNQEGSIVQKTSLIDHSTPEYTIGSPRAVRISDGEETCLALLPTQSLSERLQEAILENRELRRLESQSDKEWESLTQTLMAVDQRVQQLEKHVADATASAHNDNSGSLPEVQRQLEEARDEQARIEQKRDLCETAFERKWMAQRKSLHGLLSDFDEIFTTRGILQPADLDRVESSFANSAHDALHSNPVASDPTDRNQTHAEESNYQNTLRYNYRITRAHLEVVENALDDRLEVFNQEADERKLKIEAGEPVEPQIDLDMRQFQYTRELTQKVIEVEAEYEEAKAAALAGGVELSDIESGFVNQPDDGYRESLDREVMGLVNMVAVQEWAEQLPDAESELWDTWLASQEGGDCPERVKHGAEAGDWNLRPIDMCDSASMVAEGRWRRRIDKWRAMCGVE